MTYSIRHADLGDAGSIAAVQVASWRTTYPGSEWATLASARGLTAAVVRVLAANPARRFYEHLGARRIKGGSLTIGEQQYAEEWYGWDDLKLLRA